MSTGQSKQSEPGVSTNGAGSAFERSVLDDTSRTALQGRALILVSNRGPIQYTIDSDGRLSTQRGSGGLVSALAGLRNHVDLTWIAAAMTNGDRRVAANPHLAPKGVFALPGLRPRFVVLPDKVYNMYYNVISNPLLWFLQHYMLDTASGPNIDSSTRLAWTKGYVAANSEFARAVKAEADSLSDPPVVLIQDYQLYLVARLARDMGVQGTFQHFVHIPWPAVGYWQILPRDMRREICSGLAANDIVGFHTPMYARNFLDSCGEFLDGAEIDYNRRTVRIGKHVCRVRAYPISIDVNDLRRTANSWTVRRYREKLQSLCAEKTIVRVDRLEPTKNILRGFISYAILLKRWPEFIGRTKFLASMVPSRTKLAEYRAYRRSVFEMIDRINERFGRPGWRPIDVFYENNYHQAIAGMTLADAFLVNPVMDGMNLVAKEMPIVNERNGVLVLSDGAGAHHQLHEGTLTVASCDVEGTAQALRRALTMPEEERTARLAKLREAIEREDIAWWLRQQLADIAEVDARPVRAPQLAPVAQIIGSFARIDRPAISRDRLRVRRQVSIGDRAGG